MIVFLAKFSCFFCCYSFTDVCRLLGDKDYLINDSLTSDDNFKTSSPRDISDDDTCLPAWLTPSCGQCDACAVFVEYSSVSTRHRRKGVRRISYREGLEHMVSAVARAYSGGLGRSPQRSPGQSPWWGSGRRSPPEAESFFVVRRPKEVADLAHFWEKSNHTIWICRVPRSISGYLESLGATVVVVVEI